MTKSDILLGYDRDLAYTKDRCIKNTGIRLPWLESTLQEVVEAGRVVLRLRDSFVDEHVSHYKGFNG